MRTPLIFAVLALGLSQAAAAEPLAFQCEGIFGPNTTHDQLVEAFGADNVVSTAIVAEEGTSPEASVVFPRDPLRRVSIIWRQGDEGQRPGFIFLAEDSIRTINGLRAGLSIGQAEGVNGKPFLLGGFNDMDRGRVISWEGGSIGASIGPCQVDVQFGHAYLGTPVDLRQALESEGSYSSQDPAYAALGAKVRNITITFP